MPAADLRACRARCEADGCGGFVVCGGTAYLKGPPAEELARRRDEHTRCTLHLGFAQPALGSQTVATDDAYSLEVGLSRESCCSVLRLAAGCCLASPCGWLRFGVVFGLCSLLDFCVLLFVYDGPTRWRAVERLMRRMSVSVPRDLVALQRFTDFAESLPQFRQAYLSVGGTAVRACDAAPELGHGEWLWARGAAGPAECPGLPEEQRRVVLYIHGGAFVLCNAATHRSLTLQVARATGAPVLVVHYRRPPQDPYPAALDDVVQAYRQVICTFPPRRVLVAGESAGGNLAVALCLRLRQMGLPLPCGLVLMSPWVDLSDFSSPSWRGHSDYLPADLAEHFAQAYAGQASATDELISPTFSCSLGVLPRTLLTYGSVESIADQNALFGERLRQAGVNVTEHVADGMVHAFPVFGDFAYGHLSRAVVFVTAVAVGALIGLLVFAVDLGLGIGPRDAAVVGGLVALCVVVAARVRSCGHSHRDFLDADGRREPEDSDASSDGSDDSDEGREGGPAPLPAPLEVFRTIGAFSREVWSEPAGVSPAAAIAKGCW